MKKQANNNVKNNVKTQFTISESIVNNYYVNSINNAKFASNTVYTTNMFYNTFSKLLNSQSETKKKIYTIRHIKTKYNKNDEIVSYNEKIISNLSDFVNFDFNEKEIIIYVTSITHIINKNTVKKSEKVKEYSFKTNNEYFSYSQDALDVSTQYLSKVNECRFTEILSDCKLIKIHLDDENELLFFIANNE